MFIHYTNDYMFVCAKPPTDDLENQGTGCAPADKQAGNEFYDACGIKARMTSGSNGSLAATLITDGTPGSSQSFSCVNNTGDWLWFRFKAGTMQPLMLSGLSNAHTYALQIASTSGSIDVDQIVIAEDKNLALQPQPDFCSSIATALCSPSVFTINSGNVADVADGTTSITDQIIELTVNLTLDPTVPFDFTGKTVICSPNVKITVPASGSLTIDNSHLMACSSLWDGIVLEDETSVLTVDNSVIEDAFNAIKIDGDPATAPAISVSNSTFDHNAISIRENGEAVTDYSTMTITNCTFRCKDRHLLLPAPFDDNVSYSHIVLNAPENLTIGTSASDANIFADAEYGIVLGNPVSFNIDYNIFKDMISVSRPLLYARTANAYTYSMDMYQEARPVPMVASGYGLVLNSYIYTPVPTGTRSITHNVFENMRNGFSSVGTQADFENNTLSNIEQAAVEFSYISGASISCAHNSIGTVQNGIVINNCIGNTAISIDKNNMSIKTPADYMYYTSGISVVSNQVATNNISITDNYIYSQGTYGILALNEPNLTITGNSVHMEQPYSFVKEMPAVDITGCSNAVVSCNVINGSFNGDDELLKGRIGLRAVNSSDITVSQNELKYVQKGLLFIQNCDNSSILANILGYMNLGIVAGDEFSVANGVVGDQYGIGSEAPGNEYNGTGNSVFIAYDGSPTIFGGTFRFNTSAIVINNINMSTNVNDPNTGDCIKCYTSAVNGSSNGGPFSPQFADPPYQPASCVSSPLINIGSIAYMEAICSDTLPDDDALKNTVVYRKYSLYEFLSNNINYLDSSAVIDSFYTACNFDNIGALFALNQKMTELADTAVLANKSTLLDKLTEAGALTSALNTTDAYSINQRNVNKVLFKLLVYGSELLNADDSTALASIANQCLYTGGLAVAQARALYNAIEEYRYYDETALCPGGISARMGGNAEAEAKQPDKKRSAGVYPNPNTGTFNVTLSEKAENGWIEITDIAGRLISRKPLADDALVTTLAIEAAHGSYFYCIKGNGKVIKNGKIIIMK